MEKEKTKFNRIRIVLAEKEKSNRWLASVLDLNENTVSRWVNNVAQPEIKTLFKIANLLSVEVSSLLEGNATNNLGPKNKNTHDTGVGVQLGQSIYLVEIFDNEGNTISLTLLSDLPKTQSFCHVRGIVFTDTTTVELETNAFVLFPRNTNHGRCTVSRLVVE